MKPALLGAVIKEQTLRKGSSPKGLQGLCQRIRLDIACSLMYEPTPVATKHVPTAARTSLRSSCSRHCIVMGQLLIRSCVSIPLYISIRHRGFSTHMVFCVLRPSNPSPPILHRTISRLQRNEKSTSLDSQKTLLYKFNIISTHDRPCGLAVSRTAAIPHTACHKSATVACRRVGLLG